MAGTASEMVRLRRTWCVSLGAARPLLEENLRPRPAPGQKQHIQSYTEERLVLFQESVLSPTVFSITETMIAAQERLSTKDRGARRVRTTHGSCGGRRCGWHGFKRNDSPSCALLRTMAEFQGNRIAESKDPRCWRLCHVQTSGCMATERRTDEQKEQQQIVLD